MLVELAGNPSSRMPRKSVHGEVSHWRGSAIKPPKGDASRSCWRLVGADHHVQQGPVAEEGTCIAGTGGWRSHVCLWQLAARAHQNQEPKVPLPVMSLHGTPLTKLRVEPAGKRKNM